MALFRGIQEYIALDANNITLVFDSGNIVNISGNISLYPPQGHPILYKNSFFFQGDYVWLEPEQNGEFTVPIGAMVKFSDSGQIQLIDDDKRVSLLLFQSTTHVHFY